MFLISEKNIKMDRSFKISTHFHIKYEGSIRAATFHGHCIHKSLDFQHFS